MVLPEPLAPEHDPALALGDLPVERAEDRPAGAPDDEPAHIDDHAAMLAAAAYGRRGVRCRGRRRGRRRVSAWASGSASGSASGVGRRRAPPAVASSRRGRRLRRRRRSATGAGTGPPPRTSRTASASARRDGITPLASGVGQRDARRRWARLAAAVRRRRARPTTRRTAGSRRCRSTTSASGRVRRACPGPSPRGGSSSRSAFIQASWPVSMPDDSGRRRCRRCRRRAASRGAVPGDEPLVDGVAALAGAQPGPRVDARRGRGRRGA